MADVERRAAWLIRAKELRRDLDTLGDHIGPNEPPIANVVWAATGQMDEAIRMLREAIDHG